MGVGTSTGHILLYDIRSSRPLLIKDHFYGIPIKKLLFHSTLDQVISLDAKSVKVSSTVESRFKKDFGSDQNLS